MTSFTLLCLISTYLLLVCGDPIVQLPNGQISGREDTTFENKKFYAFEGIPYAAPPVGPLRFQAPQPAPSWDGILDTTNLTAICHQTNQISMQETEDCLYANVYTPQLPDGNTSGSLPVMFFIHGGAFLDGSSKDYRPNYIVNNDVILVTINYRLGVFGFLSTQDDVIPGNAGLKDQQLAIQWAHDNIRLFGGDPNKITIFGQSAGGASISYQLLNPNIDGLIAGAILQSGCFLRPATLQRNAREIAFATASILNSDFKQSNDSQALFEYLQTVDPHQLDAAASQYNDKNSGNEKLGLIQGYVYAPVIEAKNPTAIFTRRMYGLLQAGNFLKVPILTGITEEEALTYYQDADAFRDMVVNFDQHLDWLVSDDMQIDDQSERQKMGGRIAQLYGGAPLVDHLGDAIRFFSDSALNRPGIKYAELASKYVNTYFYQFSYDGQLGRLDTHYDGAGAVGHAAELWYLFCLSYDCDPDQLDDDDKVTQDRLAKLWTDFAKYQNPTPEASDLLQNVIWPLVETDGGDFLYLDIGGDLQIKNHPKQEVYESWVQLYDSLDTDDFDTY